jgi:hypothetical protein
MIANLHLYQVSLHSLHHTAQGKLQSKFIFILGFESLIFFIASSISDFSAKFQGLFVAQCGHN